MSSTMSLERPQSSASSRSGYTTDSTNIDWDRLSPSVSTSRSPSVQPMTPSPRSRRIELPNVDTTPMSKLSLSTSSRGEAEVGNDYRHHQSRRSLADLLRLHGEKGRGNIQTLHMTDDEEDMLREALDSWINSEDDDRSFHHDDSNGSSPQSVRGIAPTMFEGQHARSPTAEYSYDHDHTSSEARGASSTA